MNRWPSLAILFRPFYFLAPKNFSITSITAFKYFGFEQVRSKTKYFKVIQEGNEGTNVITEMCHTHYIFITEPYNLEVCMSWKNSIKQKQKNNNKTSAFDRLTINYFAHSIYIFSLWKFNMLLILIFKIASYTIGQHWNYYVYNTLSLKYGSNFMLSLSLIALYKS